MDFMKHPKYTLELTNNTYFPYRIMEHIAGETAGLISTQYCGYATFDEALRSLQSLSNGPILLASSYQPVDNTFDVRNG